MKTVDWLLAVTGLCFLVGGRIAGRHLTEWDCLMQHWAMFLIGGTLLIAGINSRHVRK